MSYLFSNCASNSGIRSRRIVVALGRNSGSFCKRSLTSCLNIGEYCPLIGANWPRIILLTKAENFKMIYVLFYLPMKIIRILCIFAIRMKS